MTVTIKRNDTKQTVDYQCLNLDGTVENLVDTTVVFNMGTDRILMTHGTATITDAANGKVSYQLTDQDTLNAGVFKGEFQVTYVDGKQKTFPSDGYIYINIEQNVDGTITPYVVDQVTYRNSEFQAYKAQIDAELQQIQTSGDASIEVEAARVEEDGTSHATLKARLDATDNEYRTGIATNGTSITDLQRKSGYGTAFPVNPSPKVADRFFRTDLGAEFIYSGSAWVQLANNSDVTNNNNTLTAKVKTLDEAPYFHLNNNSPQNMSGSFTWITFQPGHVTYSSGFTPATNSITVNVDGIYYVEAWINLSGLNPEQYANLFIRVVQPDNKSAVDHAINQIGWQGAGWNTSGVILRNSKLLKLSPGQMVQFLYSASEGPRNINQIVANCFKVSKNTVGI